WVSLSEGEAWVGAELSRPIVEGWINFIGVAFSLPVLIGYSMACGCTLWERRSLTFWGRLENLLLGAAVWLMAFPLVTVAAEGVRDISRLFVEGAPLNQVAVRHLKETYGDNLLLTMSTVAIFAFVPIIEEILFRGFLQNWLKSLFGTSKAILLTALTFTIVHFSPSQGIANVELIVGLFLLALFLGFLYERQQCLWPCIGLHCCFNAISVTMILLEMGT
ncbi:MAG: CPBP family intramembrane metalloprotease, partial [Nitrosomonas sp.]